jgi:hypothetical protein
VVISITLASLRELLREEMAAAGLEELLDDQHQQVHAGNDAQAANENEDAAAPAAAAGVDGDHAPRIPPPPPLLPAVAANVHVTSAITNGHGAPAIADGNAVDGITITDSLSVVDAATGEIATSSTATDSGMSSSSLTVDSAKETKEPMTIPVVEQSAPTTFTAADASSITTTTTTTSVTDVDEHTPDGHKVNNNENGDNDVVDGDDGEGDDFTDDDDNDDDNDDEEDDEEDVAQAAPIAAEAAAVRPPPRWDRAAREEYELQLAMERSMADFQQQMTKQAAIEQNERRRMLQTLMEANAETKSVINQSESQIPSSSTSSSINNTDNNVNDTKAIPSVGDTTNNIPSSSAIPTISGTVDAVAAAHGDGVPPVAHAPDADADADAAAAARVRRRRRRAARINGENNGDAAAAAAAGGRRRRRHRRQQQEAAAAAAAAEELIEDMPLGHWLGFTGDLSFFGIHLLSVTVFNFLFLAGVFFVPLNLGRLAFVAMAQLPSEVALHLLGMIIYAIRTCIKSDQPFTDIMTFDFNAQYPNNATLMAIHANVTAAAAAATAAASSVTTPLINITNTLTTMSSDMITAATSAAVSTGSVAATAVEEVVVSTITNETVNATRNVAATIAAGAATTSSLTAPVLFANLLPDTLSSLSSIHEQFHMEMVTLVLVGYLVYILLALLFTAIHHQYSTPTTRLVRSIVRHIFIGSKVCGLIACELIVFPIIIGWSMDLLTLQLLDSSISARQRMFLRSPFTSTVIHWFIGLIFMLHISFFASLLRKTLRKAVLSRFIRYPDDAQFNPFRELLQLPVLTHLRRLAVSCVMYITLVIFCVHLPAKLATKAFPSLTPIHIRLSDPTEMVNKPLSIAFMTSSAVCMCLPVLVRGGFVLIAN